MDIKKTVAVFFACLGCLGGPAASAIAQTSWLTVVGDSADPKIDTIEVDPIAIATDGAMRTMRIRVSRPLERTSTDGVVFMSYRAVVLFDCNTRSARFLSADFYRSALWQGEPNDSVVYAANVVRPLAFRGFEPNPVVRIVRAACQGANGEKK